MASTSIYRNIASTGNSNICTVSLWFKRGITGVEKALFGGWRSNTDRFQIRIKSDNKMDVEYGYSGSWYSLITTRLFRDTSAWMHLVLAVDSTQATAANREKLYINGVQETSFTTEDYMPQNNNTLMTTASDEMIVGASNASSSAGSHQSWWDGCISHFQFVDGLALAPTEFGSFDTTSGIWKIKTGSYATPGTNGFHLKFENSANLDLDSSSNALTFTTEGTLIQTKDNPSSNFPTLSRTLGKQGTQYYLGDSVELVDGNLKAKNHSNDKSVAATQELRKGKWYWEVKLIGNSNTRNMGIVRADMIGENTHFYNGSTTNGTENTINYNPRTSYGSVVTTDKADSVTQNTGMASTDSDCIVGHFLDMDNGKMIWSLNGTLINSGTSFSLPDWADGTWTKWGALPSARLDHNQQGHFNFGNGYFATTAVASAVADAGGEGSFEYSPTATIDSSSQDFRCINTKNIATYG